MNLIDLFSRKDPILSVQGELSLSKTRLQGDIWRILMTDGQGPHIATLKDFQSTYSYKMRETHLGWYAKRKSPKNPANILIEVKAKDRVLFSNKIELTDDPFPLLLAWKPDPEVHSDSLELTISVTGEAIIFVQRVVTRQALYDMAKGKGVEIGPGPSPQIVPGTNVEVSYLEEKSQEDWAKLDPGGKYGSAEADWSNFIVGKASSIPVPDDSIDFIFSSHVFEHLANPLGHLAHWRKKLKTGGVCMGVVPDLASCKDFRAPPSSLAELVAEQQEDIWEPEVRHFERFVKIRQTTRSVQNLIDDQFSIHVHYYTASNMPMILQYAVEKLNYRCYDFIYEKNHKDFHFVLYA